MQHKNIDIYVKMQHKDKYLDEAVKQKNNRYAERCNAAGLNFMACAFQTTGAICMEVTPLMDRIVRNSRISHSSTNASRLSCKNGTLA